MLMNELDELLVDIQDAYEKKDTKKLEELLLKAVVACMFYDPNVDNIISHKKLIDFLDTIDLEKLV
jgi:hypothetical protein